MLMLKILIYKNIVFQTFRFINYFLKCSEQNENDNILFLTKLIFCIQTLSITSKIICSIKIDLKSKIYLNLIDILKFFKRKNLLNQNRIKDFSDILSILEYECGNRVFMLKI